jgi:hypothetical protein
VGPVNKAHLEYCASPEWARLVEDELLPWVLDGLDTPTRRELHEDDVFVPVDPGTLAARLRAAGFAAARVDVAGDRVRFAATTGR